jgi:hypothetical protein
LVDKIIQRINKKQNKANQKGEVQSEINKQTMKKQGKNKRKTTPFLPHCPKKRHIDHLEQKEVKKTKNDQQKCKF